MFKLTLQPFKVRDDVGSFSTQAVQVTTRLPLALLQYTTDLSYIFHVEHTRHMILP